MDRFDSFTRTLSPLHGSVARGGALMLGVFTALNILAFRPDPFDANTWWIDVSMLPGPTGAALIVAAAAALLATAAGLGSHAAIRSVVGAVLIVTLCNAAGFFALWAKGRITPGVPVPASMLIAVLLGLIVTAPTRPPTRRGHLAAVAMAGVLAVGFAGVQMFCFGQTNYQRSADAAVVFGCRAYADGTPSDALADRVRTACDLYRQGWVDRLVFSGGPGDGAVHETEAMRRMAVSLGVPDDAILLDEAGLNTRQTVTHTLPMFEAHGIEKVLAVSHAYHLPRVKLAYHQAGREVYTVPAKERYTLRAMPYLMARETAAWWKYYFEA